MLLLLEVSWNLVSLESLGDPFTSRQLTSCKVIAWVTSKLAYVYFDGTSRKFDLNKMKNI